MPKAPRPVKAPKARAAVAIDELRCPLCGQANLVAGKRGWGCARWREGCGFVVWFETAGRTLTPSQLRDLIVKGQTRKAQFSPQAGTTVEGRLVLETESGGVRFVPER
jgi:DNA topoisomerase-3